MEYFRMPTKICMGEGSLDELKNIENLESSSKLIKVICSGLGSGSFCYLFGGSFYDTFVSFIAMIIFPPLL